MKNALEKNCKQNIFLNKNWLAIKIRFKINIQKLKFYRIKEKAINFIYFSNGIFK